MELYYCLFKDDRVVQRRSTSRELAVGRAPYNDIIVRDWRCDDSAIELVVTIGETIRITVGGMMDGLTVAGRSLGSGDSWESNMRETVRLTFGPYVLEARVGEPDPSWRQDRTATGEIARDTSELQGLMAPASGGGGSAGAAPPQPVKPSHEPAKGASSGGVDDSKAKPKRSRGVTGFLDLLKADSADDDDAENAKTIEEDDGIELEDADEAMIGGDGFGAPSSEIASAAAGAETSMPYEPTETDATLMDLDEMRHATRATEAPRLEAEEEQAEEDLDRADMTPPPARQAGAATGAPSMSSIDMFGGPGGAATPYELDDPAATADAQPALAMGDEMAAAEGGEEAFDDEPAEKERSRSRRESAPARVGSKKQKMLAAPPPPSPAPEPSPVSTRASRRKDASVIRRKSTVRYYKRMNPARNFPLRVMITREDVQLPAPKKEVGHATGAAAGFAVSMEAPVVRIVPRFPGCLCVPDQLEIDVSSPETDVTFWITPQFTGELPEARVEVWHQGRCADSIACPTKVSNRTAATIGAVGGLALPIFFTTVEGLQASETGQSLLQQASAAVGGMGVLGAVAGGILLVGSGISWWLGRSREASPVESDLVVER